MLKAAAQEGMTGGRIYDAHIAHVARAAGATVIVTDNRRHFLASLRYGIRVETPGNFCATLKTGRRNHLKIDQLKSWPTCVLSWRPCRTYRYSFISLWAKFHYGGKDNRVSQLPIVGNGPPGHLRRRGEHQNLSADRLDRQRRRLAGFCPRGIWRDAVRWRGKRTTMFVRIREMLPEDQLSPARSHTMRLNPEWVSKVWLLGELVWQSGPPQATLDF